MSKTIFKAQAVYPNRSCLGSNGVGNPPFEWVIGTVDFHKNTEKTWLTPVGATSGQSRIVWRSTLVELVPGSEPEAQEVTVRARVLDEAKRITATDRNSAYGEPEDNFQRIADFWNTFLGPKLKDGSKITPGDTAALMIMVKLAREMNAPTEDNKVDIAGYAACWAEVDARA